ncbi:MAG: hypothetical protein C4346_00355 [Chloroflexota bacterium]
MARALEWIRGSGYDRLVTAVRLGDGFTKRRDETFTELTTLLGVWRDVLLLRTRQNEYLTVIEAQGAAAELMPRLEALPIRDIHRAVCSVQACISDLESNVRPRLAMEAMVLQWPTL